MTQHVWIAQCLCPSRHCVLASAGEADDAEDAEAKIAMPLRDAVHGLIQYGVLNPWCGLCNAKPETWRYEMGCTRFATLDEAKPELDRLQAEQALTNVLFGDMKERP